MVTFDLPGVHCGRQSLGVDREDGVGSLEVEEREEARELLGGLWGPGGGGGVQNSLTCNNL